MLVAHAPAGIDRLIFVSGGSEATEAAIAKLARRGQYWVRRASRRGPARSPAAQSHHGNTIGALSVAATNGRRAQFGPLLLDMSHRPLLHGIPVARAGREPRRLRAARGQCAGDELALGLENVMGFIAGFVVGATAGALTPAPGYFKRIREICDQYGILLILDEVMCGMGRTGTLFACEQDGRPIYPLHRQGLGRRATKPSAR
ncbi:MAG: aminotransferase class III-fold pyridoxal phosphate-dependent enzyme [Paracoccaceae bacterium]